MSSAIFWPKRHRSEAEQAGSVREERPDEHVAKRRIKQAADLADEMRPTGGKHRGQPTTT